MQNAANAYAVSLDFSATARVARRMTDDALAFTVRDCFEAGEAAFALELAGCRVSKSQGYYSDEATVYAAEIARRAAKVAA